MSTEAWTERQVQFTERGALTARVGREIAREKAAIGGHLLTLARLEGATGPIARLRRAYAAWRADNHRHRLNHLIPLKFALNPGLGGIPRLFEEDESRYLNEAVR